MEKIIRLITTSYFIILVFISGSEISAQSIDSLRGAYDALSDRQINNPEDTLADFLLFKMVQTYTEDNQIGTFSSQLKSLTEKKLGLIGANHPLQKVYKNYLAYAFNDLGMFYRERVQTLPAIEYLHQSLSMYQELNRPYELGEVYNNIATVYYDVGDKDKALEFYQLSYNILKKINKIKDIEQVLANVAYLHFTKKQYDTSLKYYNIGLDLAQKEEDQKFISEFINGKGLVYTQQKKYGEALSLFEKSLQIRLKIKDKKGIAATLNNIGSCYIEQKNYAKALEYSAKSLEMSRELKSFERMRQAAFTLKDVYEKLGNYQQAYKMFELYIQLRDSTNNVMTRKEALKKQLQYDYEKREIILRDEQLRQMKLYEQKQKYYTVITIGSIILLIIMFFSFYFRNKFKKEKESKNLHILLKDRLKQEISEKESIANSFIHIQEEEREKLAAELHDGVNQLLFAAKMQLQAAKSTDEPMHKEAIKLLETAIQEIRSIAGNQGSFLLNNKSLHDALTDLSLQMKGNQAIEISFLDRGLDEENLNATHKTSVLRIIQELLNNAIKHSHSKKSYISVKTTKNKILFSVTDKGIGMFQEPNKSGNGLKNIRNKVVLMKGKMKVFSIPNAGTKVYVEIPIN